MKQEYAINFSEYEVRAALENRKSQVRRIVKPVQSMPKIPPLTMIAWLFDGIQEEDDDGRPYWVGYHPEYPSKSKWFTCPYGKAGTRLWARETFRFGDGMNRSGNPELPTYNADWPDVEGIWRSSTQMPRWASRLTFEIVKVRVERVQDIREEDILAEGITVNRIADWCNVPWSAMPTLHDAWRVYWEHVNGKGAWERNNWAWAIDLKRVEE